MGLRSELAGCLFTCPTGDLRGHKHITLSLWVTCRLCKMEAMILGRNSVRTAILCTECHVWLSTVMWQIYAYYYLNFFQDIPKYQRTIANIFKDFSIDLQSVELLGVTYTHVLELLVEKQNQTFQGVLILLSKEFLRGRNENFHGVFYQRVQLIPAQSWVWAEPGGQPRSLRRSDCLIVQGVFVFVFFIHPLAPCI